MKCVQLIFCTIFLPFGWSNSMDNEDEEQKEDGANPPPPSHPLFTFLPENGRNKYSLGEVECNGNPMNGTTTIEGNYCIGEITLTVDAVNIPYQMKSYEYKLPRPSDTIRAYQIHFGAFNGKLRGKLTWGGEWPPKNGAKRPHFWILLSRFGKYVDGKVQEPRHLVGKGAVGIEDGKFELDVEGTKPKAMYIWIYRRTIVGCQTENGGGGDAEEEEECAEGDQKNGKISDKLVNAIIVENPTLSDDEYSFEYEIDMDGADDNKMAQFTSRYTNMFRPILEERWDDWWDPDNHEWFRWAESIGMRLQQIDFVFAATNDAGNGTFEGEPEEKEEEVIVSGKPAIIEQM